MFKGFCLLGLIALATACADKPPHVQAPNPIKENLPEAPKTGTPDVTHVNVTREPPSPVIQTEADSEEPMVVLPPEKKKVPEAPQNNKTEQQRMDDIANALTGKSHGPILDPWLQESAKQSQVKKQQYEQCVFQCKALWCTGGTQLNCDNCPIVCLN